MLQGITAEQLARTLRHHSRAQITRLIQQYRQGGELQPARYRRHRRISVAQIYRLRRRRAYRQCRSASGAGPTRKASPAFCEWIRCIKGIAMASRASTTSNAVDEVTQWQVVGATAAISEAWLEPLLKAISANRHNRLWPAGVCFRCVRGQSVCAGR